jgi:hypothetical protein
MNLCYLFNISLKSTEKHRRWEQANQCLNVFHHRYYTARGKCLRVLEAFWILQNYLRPERINPLWSTASADLKTVLLLQIFIMPSFLVISEYRKMEYLCSRFIPFLISISHYSILLLRYNLFPSEKFLIEHYRLSGRH